jgi:aspartate kinase
MAILVQKYGGSSVATVERIRLIAERIVARKRTGMNLVVVVSAMGNTTNQLIATAREVVAEPPRRELDMLLSVGERITTALLSMAIQSLGEEAISFTGSQCGILTTDNHSRARIMEVRPFRVQDELDHGRIVIVAGFQGTSYKREITTLGRGGSDLTAVALAAALNAEACEIYTDVDGVLTADPRIVPSATKIEALSYDEMDAMSRGGAKVLHRDAVAWARRAGVALYSRSTFVPESEGTVVRTNPPAHTGPVVAVTGRKDLYVIDASPDHLDDVEALLEAVPTAGRFQVGAAVRWVLTREDLHEADSLAAALASTGASVRSPVGSVSVIGSGLGEDRDTYRAIRAHFGGYESLLTGTVWTAWVPVEAVDSLVKALHTELLD